MLILQFFEGLWFPCWLQSASFRRPALVGGIPGTPAVYRVTRNRASFRRLDIRRSMWDNSSVSAIICRRMPDGWIRRVDSTATHNTYRVNYANIVI